MAIDVAFKFREIFVDKKPEDSFIRIKEKLSIFFVSFFLNTFAFLLSISLTLYHFFIFQFLSNVRHFFSLSLFPTSQSIMPLLNPGWLRNPQIVIDGHVHHISLILIINQNLLEHIAH